MKFISRRIKLVPRRNGRDKSRFNYYVRLSFGFIIENLNTRERELFPNIFLFEKCNYTFLLFPEWYIKNFLISIVPIYLVSYLYDINIYILTLWIFKRVNFFIISTPTSNVQILSFSDKNLDSCDTKFRATIRIPITTRLKTIFKRVNLFFIISAPTPSIPSFKYSRSRIKISIRGPPPIRN